MAGGKRRPYADGKQAATVHGTGRAFMDLKRGGGFRAAVRRPWFFR